VLQDLQELSELYCTPVAVDMKMHAIEESIESHSTKICLRHLRVPRKVGLEYITHIANLIPSCGQHRLINSDQHPSILIVLV
jgi:hypothetical protein